MKTTCLFAILAASCLFIAPVQAAIQVYTNRTDFLAALDSYYLESFDSLTEGSLGSQPKTFNGSDFSFRASSSNLLWAGSIGGGGVDIILTVGFPDDTLTIDSLAGPTPITAIGGYFFMTLGSQGAPESSAGGTPITITAGTLSETHGLPTVSPARETFLGFISTGEAFTQLSFAQPVPEASVRYVATNDFIVGTAAVQGAIPEAGSLAIWGLLGAIFSVVGWRGRERAAQVL